MIPNRQPNVLFILTDDQQFDAIGALGNDFDPSGECRPEKGRVVPRYSSEMFTDAALEFFDQDRNDDPFFAYLAYTVPHDPIVAGGFWEKYEE